MSDVGSEPDLTVILAVHAAEDLVGQAVERILSQRDVALELVLVVDGSADGTHGAALRAVAGDERARVIALPQNRGLGNARRIGFSSARGRYVWNVDVDDYWPPEAMRELLGTADAAGADLVLASATRRSADGAERPLPAPRLSSPISGRGALALLLDGGVTGHLWNKLIARSLLSEDVYTDAIIHSDLVMVAPLLSRARVVVAHAPSVYVYNETPGSNIRSTKPRGRFLQEAWARIQAAIDDVAPDLRMSRDFRQFHQRVIVLSLLRDAVRADYTAAESAARLGAARSEILLREVGSVLRSGHARDAALLITAAVAPGLFRRAMRR
jgi:glycosyltransferase involved in cell wall biosynthesis